MNFYSSLRTSNTFHYTSWHLPHSVFAMTQTPISYYGGKQMLAQRIINLIPKHTLFCEPFLGGAAVYFKKGPSLIEVIGDSNAMVTNFYQVCKDKTLFPYLQDMVKATPYARNQWAEAKVVRQHPDSFSSLKKARAFWTLASLCFSSNIGSGFAYDRKSNIVSKRFSNKKKEFGEHLMQRLEHTCIENMDACEMIIRRDSENSFFYCDPPYVSETMGSQSWGINKVDQGHYKGYSPQDYEQLLQVLSKLKGKFILSNYPSELLEGYIELNGRSVIRIEKSIQAGLKLEGIAQNMKTEMLVANFDLHSKQ